MKTPPLICSCMSKQSRRPNRYLRWIHPHAWLHMRVCCRLSLSSYSLPSSSSSSLLLSNRRLLPEGGHIGLVEDLTRPWVKRTPFRSDPDDHEYFEVSSICVIIIIIMIGVVVTVIITIIIIDHLVSVASRTWPMFYRISWSWPRIVLMACVSRSYNNLVN